MGSRLTSTNAALTLVVALALSASACAQSGSPTVQPSVADSPAQPTIRTAPPASVDPNSGDVLFRATLTGAMTYISTGKETTDTATATVEVTFTATQGDISSLQLQGGTMSISDTAVGTCNGSGTFAGVFPPDESGLKYVTPTSGDGAGELVLNDGGDGISRNPGDPREAISVLLLLSVRFDATCGELSSPWGQTITSCLGDRSTSTTFILRKTAPGAFTGTCHDDFQGETYSGTLDWSGQIQQISP